MAFCTVEYYLQMFPAVDNQRLSDDFGMEQENLDVIENCIDAAYSEMLMFLPTIPEPYPLILQIMNAKIARKEMHSRLGMPVPQYITEEYDGIILQLNDIQSGKLTVTGVTPTRIISYSREKIYTPEAIR